MVAQHNLLEESILIDPQFRATLAKLGIAEVWIMPNISYPFDFSKGVGIQVLDVSTKDVSAVLADINGCRI